MLTKAQIIDAVNAMPEDEIEVDVLRERLLLLTKLQQAEDDILNGRTYTNEQMKEIIRQWSQSPGQKQPSTI